LGSAVVAAVLHVRVGSATSPDAVRAGSAAQAVTVTTGMCEWMSDVVTLVVSPFAFVAVSVSV